MTWPEYIGWRSFFHADDPAGPWTPDNALDDYWQGRAFYTQTDGKKPLRTYLLFAPPEDAKTRARNAAAKRRAVAARFDSLHHMLSQRHARNTTPYHAHAQQRPVHRRMR